MKILISGSREFRNLKKVDKAIGGFPMNVVILHGGARGVDARADHAARRKGLEVEILRPDWSIGKKAGPLRNRVLVEKADVVYAFWDGESRGTKGVIDYTRERGKALVVVLDEDEERNA